MNLRIIAKNHAADSKIEPSPPQNRFKSRLDSRVHPESLGVKN